MTFLFDEVIFGPVSSRRLGSSLGINLLPSCRKVCSFNCIYCECGWTGSRDLTKSDYPSREEVRQTLEARLNNLSEHGAPPDSITFAGNGEPTLHPDFEGIVDDSINLRNSICPESKIVVLSNGSMADREYIRRALLKADQNILKLDTGFENTFRALNQPPENIRLSDIIQNLKSFKGKLIIQTLFIRGKYHDKWIDNTTEKETGELLKLYKDIQPEMIMVYTIARGTPIEGLERISYYELKVIADRIEDTGIKTQISA
jgi:wyosine [tRNA(Phe)-imidazoG37] synthetase (radical SAM superfamily)